MTPVTYLLVSSSNIHRLEQAKNFFVLDDTEYSTQIIGQLVTYYLGLNNSEQSVMKLYDLRLHTSKAAATHLS